MSMVTFKAMLLLWTPYLMNPLAQGPNLSPSLKKSNSIIYKISPNISETMDFDEKNKNKF